MWLAAAVIRDPAAAQDWVALLSLLPEDAFARTLAHGSLARGAMFLMPQMLALEADKRPPNEGIADALESLHAIEFAGRTRNVPLLSASAVAASLKLRARRVGEREPALLVAEHALESYSTDKDAEFTLRDALANEFALANRVPEAIEAYSRAVELGSSVASVNHLHAAIRLSQLTRGSDPLRSLECANRAVELAHAASGLPHTERVRALAELGIAIADTKDVRDAFPVWCDAAAELLASEPQTDLERGMFAIFGHCLGYYTSIACTGTPPKELADGEGYAKPLAGMFLQDTARAAPVYRASGTAVLAAQLEMYADAVGASDAAVKWGRRATELAEGGDEETRALLTMTALPFQLRGDAFQVAIDGGIAFGSMAARRGRPPSVPLSAEEAERVEAHARNVVLVPAFMRAATLRMQGAPTATAAATELANACRTRATISGDHVWGFVASAIDKSLGDSAVDIGTLEDLRTRAYATQELAVKSIGALAVSLSCDVPLGRSFAEQVTVLEGWKGFRESSAMSKLIKLEFLCTFWRQAVVREPFRFANTRAYNTSITEALAGGDELSVRSLMSATAFSLALRLPDFVNRWLVGQV